MRSQSQSRGLPSQKPASPGAFTGRDSSSRSAGETRLGVPSSRSSGLESRSSGTGADRGARSQALESLRQRANSVRSMADLMKAQSQSRGTAGKGNPSRLPTTRGSLSRATPRDEASSGQLGSSEVSRSASRSANTKPESGRSTREQALEVLRERINSGRTMADLMRAQSSGRGISNLDDSKRQSKSAGISKDKTDGLGAATPKSRSAITKSETDRSRGSQTLDALREQASSARTMAELMRAQSQRPRSAEESKEKQNENRTIPLLERLEQGNRLKLVEDRVRDSNLGRGKELRLGDVKPERIFKALPAPEVATPSTKLRLPAKEGHFSRNTVVRIGGANKDRLPGSLKISSSTKWPTTAGLHRANWNAKHPHPKARYCYPHHRHHAWYHGGWSSIRFDSWYRPPCYRGWNWGVGLWLDNWGYGVRYINPYCTRRPVWNVTVYDYSHPIILKVPTAISETSVYLAEDLGVEKLTSAEERSIRLFADARMEFKRRRFDRALELSEQAIPLNPDDVILHEFYALCLFALAQYDDAAIVLNSLLAVSSGMDLETLEELYDSPDTYRLQRQMLEDHVQGDSGDVSARFVLAYHLIVAGEVEEASRWLREVVRIEPEDRVAKQLLADLELSDPKADVALPSIKTPLILGKPDEASVTDERSTDLAGRWLATQGEVTIELELAKEGTFVWKRSEIGQPERIIEGAMTLAGDVLVLEGGTAGTFVGKVEPSTDDQFRFQLLNSNASDQGLIFARQK